MDIFSTNYLQSELFIQSPCPYFTVSHENYISIAGGGGPSKSGVPNLLQVFNQGEVLAEFNTFQDVNYYVLKQNDTFFLAGSNVLRKLSLKFIKKQKKYKLVETLKIDIEEPRGLIEWKNLLLLAYNNEVLILSQSLKIIKKFPLNEDERIINISANDKEQLCFTVQTNCGLYEINAGIDFTNYNLEMGIQSFSFKYRKVTYFSEDKFLSISKKSTFVDILNKQFESVFRLNTKHDIANYVYNSQEKLLVTISLTGLVQIYKLIGEVRFKLICKKQSKIDNFIHDLSFYSERYEVCILGVDGFETMKIQEIDRRSQIGWIIIAILIFIMAIWLKSIREYNLK